VLGVKVVCTHRCANPHTIQTRTLIALKLQDVEQAGLLVRRRNDGQMASLIVEQEPSGRDTGEIDARRNELIEQIDHVVVVDKGVCEQDEGFREEPLAISATDVGPHSTPVVTH
jgi:hypothetical protein